MITLIEALNYRCLRSIAQPMGPFHVLVGPNASGKTTFLDVVAFLGNLVEKGIEEAVASRTQNFYDLVWGRSEGSFELAVEARIPETLRERIGDQDFDRVRYEVALGIGEDSGAIELHAETVLLRKAPAHEPPQLQLFPRNRTPPATLLLGTKHKGSRTIINKVPGGNDNFYSETYSKKGKGWVPAFKLGARRSALANLPEDETRFPVSTWLKDLLTEGTQQLVLNSLLIRRASPPGKGRRFKPDGSNLPWVVADLEQRAPERVSEWVEHLRTALPDLESIRTVERPDDRHRYLVLGYRGGLEIPSWMASDGTLRMLALTLPAYLPGLSGTYLIEEPENGIHPKAVETIFQSLSSVYDAQILMATHSPVVLSTVEPKDVLCFAKTADGATDIVLGSDHPKLREWQGETNLGTLFAAGVLG